MKTQDWIDNNFTPGGPNFLLSQLGEELRSIIRNTPVQYRTKTDRKQIRAIHKALRVLRTRAEDIDDTVVHDLPSRFQDADPEWVRQEKIIKQELEEMANPGSSLHRRWYQDKDPNHDRDYTPPSLGKRPLDETTAGSKYSVNFHFN